MSAQNAFACRPISYICPRRTNTLLARPEVAAQCRALGAHHFFDKSREFLEVMPAIEAFLDQHTGS